MTTRNISKVINYLVLGIIAGIVITLPLGYFSLVYKQIVGELVTESEINARIISNIIGQNPLMWEFEQTRIEEYLIQRPQKRYPEIRRVFNHKNEIVAEASDKIESPFISRKADLLDAGRAVGKIEVIRSLRPLLRETGGLFLSIAIVGAVLFFVINRLYLRVLVNAEEKLHISEKKYRTIFENSRDAIYMTSHSGKIIDANQSTFDLFGYRREEMIGRSISMIFKEDTDRVKYEREIEKKGFIRDYELELLRKDGAVLPCLVTSVLNQSKSGGISGYESVVRDITERKLFEHDLLESELRYRTLFDHSPDGILIIDINGKFIEFNETAHRLLEFSREEFSNLRIADVEANQSAEEIQNAINDLLATGKAEFEVQHKTKSGDIRDVYVISQVMVLSGQTFFHAIWRDITERKQAEEEKRSLEERLQRAEKMEALGTLAGGVAHDLNNVLGIIVGYAEILLYKTNESSPIRPRLVEIMKGGERAAAIVQDLLTLARRGVPGRQILNLNSIIADCQKLPEFEKLSTYHSSVRIKTDLEPDLLNISGSSVHLSKTLFNLISNASEAMPDGGILTIKTANQYLDRLIYGYDEVREGDYVVLSVSDTGEGIAAADMKRIFEPFYTKKVMGRSGTGLGLAVVWGTVKDHHGYINVQSEEGKGSTFTLYFPVTREEITAEHVTISMSEYMGNGESILIVDDVRGQRELAADILRLLNYHVASVSSGEEAVAYMKECRVDLMVLDMIMDPGMDGLDTYRSVLAIYPKQKAIIVSGFSETERVHAAQALGVGAYVRKPYVLERLGLAVRKELDRST